MQTNMTFQITHDYTLTLLGLRGLQDTKRRRPLRRRSTQRGSAARVERRRSGLRGKELRGNVARGSELRGNGARPNNQVNYSINRHKIL